METDSFAWTLLFFAASIGVIAASMNVYFDLVRRTLGKPSAPVVKEPTPGSVKAAEETSVADSWIDTSSLESLVSELEEAELHARRIRIEIQRVQIEQALARSKSSQNCLN